MRLDSISAALMGHTTAQNAPPVSRPLPIDFERPVQLTQVKPPLFPQKAAEAERSPAPDERSVEAALQSLNQDFRPHGISLRFSQDDKSKTVVVEVVDERTGETLRQIPDETMLKLSNALSSLQGRVVDREV